MELVQGEVAQLGEGMSVRGQAICKDWKNSRVAAPHTEFGSLRQTGQYLVNCRLYLQHGRDHIFAPVKINGYIGTSAAGSGTYVAHTGNGSHRLLDWPCYFKGHALCRAISGI